ncbi:MAG: translocation/assembly module TamB domain-containing protein [Paludibacteraceae bacterium]
MKIFKYIGKTVGWILTGLIALVLIFFVALQTKPVKRIIAQKLQVELNKILDAELSIKSIDGNFFNGIGLNNVFLKQKGDTVGYIPSVKLKYRLLPLLQGSILINSVEMDNPIVYITQYEDSTWNFGKLMKPKERTDTVPTPFTMKLNIDKIRVDNGTFIINALDTIFPRKISSLNSDVSFNYFTDMMELNFRQLSFVARRPDLTLKNMSFYLKKDSNHIQIRDFILQSEKNRITANVEYDSGSLKSSFADVNADSLYLDEFQFLYPDLKISGHPTLALKARFNSENSTVKLDLNEKKESVSFNLQSRNLVDYLNKITDEPLAYNFNGQFVNINMQNWIDDSKMQYKFTGNVFGQGLGIDPKKLRASVQGNFRNMVLQKRQVGKLNFDVDYSAGNLKGVVDGSGDFGTIRMLPEVKNIFSKNLSYKTSVVTDRLDLSVLMLDKKMKSNLNLHANLTGQGYDPKTMIINAKGSLKKTSMYDFLVDNLNFDLNYRKGNADGVLNGSGDFGKIYAKPNIHGVLNKYPGYSVFIKTENLNLSKLMKNDSLTSNLNMEGTISGVGYDPQKMTADVNLIVTPSSIKGININSLISNIHYSKENINIDTLMLNTSSIILNAKGDYSMHSNSDLTFNAEILNAGELAALAKLDSIETRGNINVHLFGTPKNLQGNLIFQLDSTQYKNFTVLSLNGKADGFMSPTDTVINAQLFAGNFLAGTIKLDTVEINVVSDLHTTELNLKASGEDIKTSLVGNAAIGKDIYITLNDLMLNYKGSEWKMLTTPENEYRIDNLQLVSRPENIADSLQIITVNGLINRIGEQNLDLNLANINIPSILNLLKINQNVQGNLDMSMYLRGTAKDPTMNGGFSIDNAKFNDYGFNEFAGTFDFQRGKLGLDAYVVPKDSGILQMNGYVPFAMRLDSMSFTPPTTKDSVYLHLVADKLPLKTINSFQPLDDVAGYLQSDILVDGTFENPNPIGDIHVVNGKVKLNKYGIDYRQILAAINFRKETVTVDTVFIRSKNGTMFANGNLGFQSHFYKGDINNSEISIHFDNFQPLNHKYYNMQLTGDASLHGKKDSVVFDGDVTVLEALVYLPAVMQIIGSGNLPDVSTPVLLQELDRANLHPDSVVYLANQGTDEQSKRFTYFDNLTGKIKLYIPRNTWIKNEQMRIELSGDMEVIKHREFLELFGTADVIRGQYDLLGKTFVIDDGTITFQGGKDFNPIINLEASYAFRDKNRSEHKLKLYASGELKEPKFKFTMGDQPINEGDALSYILFGTNMDALASGQQAALSTGTAGDLAQSAAASLISSELTKFLGKTLNVDYIEMRAGSSFENATFVVGKYITNKLFMSYERRFGNFKNENIAEYEVKLEYELFRFLFLQLASSPITNGLDVIFKIDSNTKFNTGNR